MMIRPKTHLLIPLLALSVTVAMAAPVHAQNYYQGSGGSSVSFQVRLGSAPRWTNVSGTHVQVIREAQRPDYDMFRYSNNYYVYNNDRWYRSRQSQGQFMMIDNREIPSELYRVPSHQWRSYPSEWQGSNGSYATIQVGYRSAPYWMNVGGTNVRMISQGGPDYDMFHYGNSYYAYNNDRWYTSHYSQGQFAYVDERNVPSELSRVPQHYWKSYPQGWGDQSGYRHSDHGNRGRYEGHHGNWDDSDHH